MRGKQQCSVVVKAIDLSKMFSTSISKTWKVLRNLHLMLLCIWTCCIHITAAPGPRSRIFWKLQIILATSGGANYIIGCAYGQDLTKLLLLSLANLFESTYSLWLPLEGQITSWCGGWGYRPIQDTSTSVTVIICCGCAYEWVLITLLLCLLAKLSKSSLEFWLPPEGQTTALFGGWG